MAKDVTAQKDAEAELARLALTDPLTGLPNHALLMDRPRQAEARVRCRPGPLAVLFLDLDRFKVVNGSLGRAAGDRLIQTVA
jgi:diguanylate cyclase (GGDEF)-like protein